MGALTIVAKYMIVAQIEVNGSVDKSDIIGALFSQTEGLLGKDMDLRELQMMGRIGRIEVDIFEKNSKTKAKIYIPSNLDRYETALVAALIESIERVGPYLANIKVLEIKDLREEKRRRIIEKAKELVKMIEEEILPDTKEIIEKLKEDVAKAEIVEYGPEKLPAGPDVEKSDSVIIVEGRADVVNLVKHGYRNVIAIEGISRGIPQTVIDLSKKKSVTVFIDGDKGGELVLRELLKVAHIDYIARAPPGKEVEQLTAKEIAKALRNKVTLEEWLAQQKAAGEKTEAPAQPTQQQPPPAEAPIQFPFDMSKKVEEMLGTLEAEIYDANWGLVKKLPVRELPDFLTGEGDSFYAIVMDGIVTQRIVDLAAKKGVKVIVTARVGPLTKVPEDMKIITFEKLTQKVA
ncbi:DNA primase DnaG [Pyrobaculum neutrophilum]|uniref:DNA primase DnaG n=1 Tax=Pyrobaculum neutrophilum (strain DSM 2338 / JCM 9278 / NBRC 100436 / V24Sta) TaxID=444157 RepID=DNAG_PYRNV|nr:DNA primase DnaG [Pyrobaculum neutrophilum]B1Y919.1 RecName: Full=DNA primase DnaG [Pyrobaculum neutrophilum V24Sta]ACB40248.1 TOPRIM domain protein [Pyrobaculum neutrophilum V24Sta]